MKLLFNFKKILLFLIIQLVFSLPIIAATGPTLLIDKNPQGSEYIYGIGPSIKYKRISAPYNFGGDMNLWGIRMFAGRLRDPAIGIMFQSGTLNGNGMKFNLDMGGLTLEDSFREDSRVKWRATIGGGHYRLRTRNSGLELNKGSFTLFEPMIVGLLPLSSHIALEFSTGYTFASGTGVRIEGLALQAEILIGKF
jgi:hypothetical protein